jgi:hypothetical protein
MPWLRRVRSLVALALVWAVLHFVLAPLLLPVGLDRPVTLGATEQPILAAVALALVVWAGSYVAPLIAGSRYGEQGLMYVAIALAVWAYPRGTMDEWLLLASPDGAVGPPTSAPYWPLLFEYIWLVVLLAVAAGISFVAGPAVGGTSDSPGQRVRRAFALNASATKRGQGLLSLVVTAVVFVVLMLLLTGPPAGETLAGQVYFAVAIASAVGVFAGTRVSPARDSIWFWPAPLLAGLLGVILAAMKPALGIPAEYNQLNSIPAWALVRPLPLQMVSVGVVASLWALRTIKAGSTPARG